MVIGIIVKQETNQVTSLLGTPSYNSPVVQFLLQIF